MNWLLIAIGGGAGALARYSIAKYIYSYEGIAFPWGTLTVNLTGSLLIGIAAGFMEMNNISISWRLFLLVGLLGGFTTFSTFTMEAAELFKSGAAREAILYILISNTGGILLALGGWYFTRAILLSTGY